MLSEDVYQRAMNELAGKPIHLSLLECLWPLVKNVNFEVVQSLKVSRPKHDLLNHAKDPKNRKLSSCAERQLVNTGISVPYSHRTIRRVLSALGLGLVSPRSFGKASLTICKKKRKKRKKRKNVSNKGA